MSCKINVREFLVWFYKSSDGDGGFIFLRLDFGFLCCIWFCCELCWYYEGGLDNV